MLGGLLSLGAIAAAALFLAGVLARSYWALALPVAAAVLFVLGLVTLDRLDDRDRAGRGRGRAARRGGHRRRGRRDARR